MSYISSILVLTDFSKGALNAIKFAEELALSTDAELHLFYCDNEVLLNHQLTAAKFRDEYEADMAKKLSDLVDEEKTEGMKIDYVIKSGDVAEEVVKYADENGADLIVMGRTGRSALSEMILGSITQQVIHKAHCPVTVVSNNTKKSK